MTTGACGWCQKPVELAAIESGRGFICDACFAEAYTDCHKWARMCGEFEPQMRAWIREMKKERAVATDAMNATIEAGKKISEAHQGARSAEKSGAREVAAVLRSKARDWQSEADILVQLSGAILDAEQQQRQQGTAEREHLRPMGVEVDSVTTTEGGRRQRAACPQCGEHSVTPTDLEVGYCPACKMWTGKR